MSAKATRPAPATYQAAGLASSRTPLSLSGLTLCCSQFWNKIGCRCFWQFLEQKYACFASLPKAYY